MDGKPHQKKPGFSKKPGFCPAKRLREIMLDYLQAARCVAIWPGGDGLTIDDVLDSYAEAVARGQVPDWHQLQSAHPDLEYDLQSWLAAKDRWQFAYRGRAKSP
jgi:hypothetical protein